MKLIEDNLTENQQPVNGDNSGYNYYEVDIEYTTQAKMVLLGKNEEDVEQVVLNGLDIPNVKIMSIFLADDDLVKEAKARRAFEEAAMTTNKEQLN